MIWGTRSAAICVTETGSPPYIAARLKKRNSTKDLGNWFESAVGQLSRVPPLLVSTADDG